MSKAGTKLLEAIAVCAVIALLIYGYREYQRDAVPRYIRSQDFLTVMELLPRGADDRQRVLITIGANDE